MRASTPAVPSAVGAAVFDRCRPPATVVPVCQRRDVPSREPEKSGDSRRVWDCVQLPKQRQSGLAALWAQSLTRQGAKLVFNLSIASALRQITCLAPGITAQLLAALKRNGYPCPVLDRHPFVRFGEFGIGHYLDPRQEPTQFRAPQALVCERGRRQFLID